MARAMRLMMVIAVAIAIMKPCHAAEQSDSVSRGRGFLDYAVPIGLIAGVNAGLTYGIKGMVKEMRPDRSNNRSFPSGHASWAFAGASVLTRELGPRFQWVPTAAYAAATAMATSRVLDRKHYPKDVLAGAGIGILAAQAGYALGDLIMGHGLNHFNIAKENSNFSFLSVAMGMSLPLGPLRFPEGKLSLMPALTASVRAGLPVEDNWGLALDLGLISTPVMVDGSLGREYAGPMNQVGGVISPYYFYVVSRRLSIYGEAGAGYYRNLTLKSTDRAVATGSGSAVGRVVGGLTMRFSDHFSARLSVGCQLSRYKFNFAPSDFYGIRKQSSVSRTMASLLVSLSSRYEF